MNLHNDPFCTRGRGSLSYILLPISHSLIIPRLIDDIKVISYDYTFVATSHIVNSPVLLSLVLEVVHVAARAQIQRILGLPLLGHASVDQVPRVLHHELPLVIDIFINLIN